MVEYLEKQLPSREKSREEPPGPGAYVLYDRQHRDIHSPTVYSDRAAALSEAAKHEQVVAVRMGSEEESKDAPGSLFLLYDLATRSVHYRVYQTREDALDSGHARNPNLVPRRIVECVFPTGPTDQGENHE